MRRTCAALTRFIALTLISACAHVPSPASDIPLRVMTYNIAAGTGNLDGIIETIRVSAADVVALQEVDVHWSARSHFADQAAALGERLGMHVRFAPIYQLPGNTASAPRREYGVGLLSRYPIVTSTNHTITRHSTQPEGTAPAPMPGFLEATVDVHGTLIRILNTHLDYRPDPTVRQQQVTETLAIIRDPVLPTLLFGDLNAPPTAPELQPLLQRLRDSWTTSSDSGLTYPATEPVKRIDYVLISSHFRVRAASVPASQSSDHRPVVVDLVVDRVRQ